MVIEYKNFKLIPGNGIYTWDLTRTVPTTAINEKIAQMNGVKVGEPTGRTKEDEIGYDYRLEVALKIIIEIILAEKEGTVNLTQYLVAYVKEKQELVEYIKKTLAVKV